MFLVLWLAVVVIGGGGVEALAPGPTRRVFVATAATAIAPALAASDDIVVEGVVESPSSEGVLYITVKKGAAPQEIAGLVRGAPEPAIGALRIPEPKFPYAFALRRSDLFPEFKDLDTTGLALTVAARLDSDGVAATRSPDDLVASTFTSSNARLVLKPRGFVKNLMK